MNNNIDNLTLQLPRLINYLEDIYRVIIILNLFFSRKTILYRTYNQIEGGKEARKIAKRNEESKKKKKKKTIHYTSSFPPSRSNEDAIDFYFFFEREMFL